MTPPSQPALRLGTRGSPLALAQARLTALALCRAHDWPEERVAMVPITTTGDVVQDRPLAEIGGKILWTKELDRALVEGRIDAAVHSMKDVETMRPDAFGFAAILPRADCRDRLIGAAALEDLPEGATVGTSSPRRAAQVRARRPDLRTVPIRGNVGTRLSKMADGEVDAILLAAAGLDRLGMNEVGATLDDVMTAPGQGAIGVEILWEREDLRALIGAIDDPATHRAVSAERAFLRRLGGDCRSAVGTRTRMTGEDVEIEAEVLLPDGSEVRRAASTDPYALADRLLAVASPKLRAMFGA